MSEQEVTDILLAGMEEIRVKSHSGKLRKPQHETIVRKKTKRAVCPKCGRKVAKLLTHQCLGCGTMISAVDHCSRPNQSQAGNKIS